MKILLVEDDDGVREGLQELLSDYAEVAAAEDVDHALSALNASPFDLVITDLRFDNDTEAGRRVAAFSREKQARVIIMSASPKADILEALGGWVPDGVIEKPFPLEEMVKLIEQEKARAE